MPVKELNYIPIILIYVSRNVECEWIEYCVGHATYKFMVLLYRSKFLIPRLVNETVHGYVFITPLSIPLLRLTDQ